MQTEPSSYRPHTSGHDYHEAGIYLVTLVVTGRERRLSALNNDENKPEILLTDVGRIVQEELDKTALIQSSKGILSLFDIDCGVSCAFSGCSMIAMLQQYVM